MDEKRIATTGERLKIAMGNKGLKQIDLVNITGLDRSQISCYISGKYEPKQHAINKLAVALDVSEMWLWGYDVPMERSETQKKNDDLVKVIAQLRKDPDFFEVVSLLAELPPEQYASVKTILSALANK